GYVAAAPEAIGIAPPAALRPAASECVATITDKALTIAQLITADLMRKLELTRVSGHLILWLQGVHDAQNPTAVPT
ncbi:MAG TPA: hypothetical protein VF852_08530, partial [Pseudolabrys sp.]